MRSITKFFADQILTAVGFMVIFGGLMLYGQFVDGSSSSNYIDDNGVTKSSYEETPSYESDTYNTPSFDNSSSSDSSVYYANCTEAKAYGKAPIYFGESGYRKALDRDGDGVACE